MASRFWVGGTGTWDASSTTNWSATSGGASGASVPSSSDDVTLNASSGGGTVTLGANVSVISISMGEFGGTLNSSTFNVTLSTFTISGSGTRALNMGSGIWTLTGNDTIIWNTGSSAGLTLTKGNAIVCNYSGSVGTRNMTANQNSETLALDFNITAGTDIVRVSSGRNLNFTGFAGSFLGSVNRTVYGNITFSAGMTYSGAATLTLGATSGTKTVTSNGMVVDVATTIDGVGGTWQLADALVVGSTRILTLTNGTFNANNQNVTCGLFASSNSNIRTITMGSGIWTLSSTGTVWNLATSTNLTLTANTSTIKITDTSATARTFSGGGKTYNNFWSSAGAGTASLTIVGSNTFADFKDDGTAAHSILFTTGTTQIVATFTVSGTAGQLITINSTTTGTHTLTKSSSGLIQRNYLNIQHSVATPSNTWFAGANSTNNQDTVTAGSGWLFPFTNPGNAYADDATYATGTASNGNIVVYLSGDAGVTWTSGLTKTFAGSDSTETYGNGSTELWGRTWNGDDSDDTSFRVLVTCGSHTGSIYKTFGFAITASLILTGVEVAINAKWATTTTSLDHVKVKIYYGTSTLPVQAGSQAYASNGRKNGEGAGLGTGVLVFYDGTAWRACDTGATAAA